MPYYYVIQRQYLDSKQGHSNIHEAHAEAGEKAGLNHGEIFEVVECLGSHGLLKDNNDNDPSSE